MDRLRTILIGLALLGLQSVNAASLTGSFALIPSGTVVDLTAAGPLDWVHWGFYTDTSLDRKAGLAPLISNFIPLTGSNGYTSIYQFADNTNSYSWSDGTPTLAITNTPTGVWAYGFPMVGTGFQITAPADTTERILNVYVGAFAASGKLEAVLSDQSASAYTNAAFADRTGNGESGVYSINYAAASAGQTLTIKWTLLQAAPGHGDANVTLQAAALNAPGANNPPIVGIASPGEYATFAAGLDISIQAQATDLDGTIALVEFFVDGNKIGEAPSSPFSLTWTNVPPGDYSLSARATDNGGASRASTPMEIFVNGQGGWLSADLSPQTTATNNLTAEGTLDWAHWGLNSATSFNHKSGVAQQISTFTRIGTGPVRQYSDNAYSFSWNDGTPKASANGTTTGVYLGGVSNGFQLTIPADTVARTLKVYLGLYGAQDVFQARLSDSSAPVYTDASLDSVFGNLYAVYTVNYRAASAGQTLIVKYTSKTLYDAAYGNLTWQAATLAHGPTNTPPSVFISSPTNNSTFIAPANITLSADAADTDGEVIRVEFFDGADRLGEATSAPYSLPWNTVPAGSYSLTAVATDNSGATTISTSVQITVNNGTPAAVTLVNPVASVDQFGFSFASESNRSYTIERTQTLNPLDWQTVTNTVGDGTILTVTIPTMSDTQQFYRVSAQ